MRGAISTWAAAIPRLRAAAVLLAVAAWAPRPAAALSLDDITHGQPLKATKHAALTFADGKTIRVDIVDTAIDRERGLMYRRRLPRDYGMLFVFSRPQPLTFWMKNTFVPLDMVYIGPDKRVTAVFKDVKASTEKTPDDDVARVGADAQFVLELPAGTASRHKVAVGQAVAFDAAIPPS